MRVKAMLRTRWVLGRAAAAAAACLALTTVTAAAERDLYSGLAYLRAGAQSQAADSLAKFRDDEPDPEVRRSVSRVLLLLRQPLPEDVREYLALTIEEKVAARPPVPARSRSSAYWSRIFPVFP